MHCHAGKSRSCSLVRARGGAPGGADARGLDVPPPLPLPLVRLLSERNSSCPAGPCLCPLRPSAPPRPLRHPLPPPLLQVLSWLMTRRRWDLNRALQFLRRARPEAEPNAGYLAALLRLEEELFGRQTVKVGASRPFADLWPQPVIPLLWPGLLSRDCPGWEAAVGWRGSVGASRCCCA